MLRQSELIERVASYIPDLDEALLNRAYITAMQAHGSQRRASGDPYFSHPVEVAGILADMKLDSATIATGLLHDVVEDTDITCADIQEKFGDEIASLVEGVTKLSRIPLKKDTRHHNLEQAENFRKFILAISKDVRVLLIKLADRLHNMRTLEHITNQAKRRRIALETSDIYAPLAQRMGMNRLCCELDDLAFLQLEPQAARRMRDHLRHHLTGSEEFTRTTIRALEDLMRRKKIHRVTVEGRSKSPSSIWRKMKERAVSLDNIDDLLAFRIVVSSIEDCYRALGVLHRKYRFIPGLFKDYISTPKPNGYRSLHTHIIGPNQHRCEIQIRSRTMEAVARMGVASHWRYKQNVPQNPQHRERKNYRWMQELLDILNHSESPEEFLSHSRLQMYRDQVFCFTPKGDIITLPKGATGLDFAYAVHTDIGRRCGGVKINGSAAALSRVLHNGDSVEVIRTREAHIPSNWAEISRTGKAQAGIRRLIRQRQREEFIALGHDILRTLCQQKNIVFGPELFTPALLKAIDLPSAEDVFFAIAIGLRDSTSVLRHILADHPSKKSPAAISIEESASNEKGLSIHGFTAGVSIHYAGCCHPLPGDDVIGIAGKGGITVHIADCGQIPPDQKTIALCWRRDAHRAAHTKSDTIKDGAKNPTTKNHMGKNHMGKNHMGKNLTTNHMGTNHTGTNHMGTNHTGTNHMGTNHTGKNHTGKNHIGRLHARLSNQAGSLGRLSSTIARNDSNISNLKIIRRNQNAFDISLDLEVHDAPHLSRIINDLQSSPHILSVARVGR